MNNGFTNKKYIVVEIQHLPDGTVAAPTYSFDDEKSANARYHQILASASVSNLPVHSAVMFNEFGQFIKGEYFVGEITE